MVLESTMLCVDNSEYMRNGDFAPTRLQCQQDAANMIIQSKLRANPENAVGILSMASEVQVLSTMTQEQPRLFMKLHQVEPRGNCNFLAGIKVAHLALKHRQNRSHRMRVVIFVGSPIENIDTAELLKVAKKFKKEKVDCDVICFGESNSDNSQIMGQFVDILNGKEANGSSSLIVVPAGTPLTDAMASLCRSEDGGNAAAGGGGGFEFGVDPEEDPDLALALRVSMEEERARQAAAAAAAGGSEGGAAAPAPAAAAAGGASSAAEAQPDVVDIDMAAMTEEEQLEWALRMSMQSDAPAAPAAPQQEAAAESMEVDVTTAEENVDDLINNPDLLQQIVNDLPSDSNSNKKDEKKDESK